MYCSEFCYENNFWVLRTMQVLEDLQRKGLERMILNRFTQLIEELKISQVFCMPYEHLENFYNLIGFKKIEESDGPNFLRLRAKSYHENHREKRVILMST